MLSIIIIVPGKFIDFTASVYVDWSGPTDWSVFKKLFDIRDGYLVLLAILFLGDLDGVLQIIGAGTSVLVYSSLLVKFFCHFTSIWCIFPEGTPSGFSSFEFNKICLHNCTILYQVPGKCI